MGGAITNPFARLRASLTPLVPDTEPAPIDASGLDGDQPFVPFPSKAPRVTLAKFDPQTATPEQLAEHPLVSRLRSDIAKDMNPWGTPENHPGFLGKLGHALSVATGGPNRRQFEEMGLQKSLQDLLNSQSRNELEGAQTQEANVRAEAGEPHEVSPMLAQALGVPELEGQMLPASAITALEKQHGINATKEKTNAQTVQGRQNVADTQVQGREDVANINAANKIQPMKAMMVKGQLRWMERDPQTKEYSIDRGEAPPTFAQTGLYQPFVGYDQSTGQIVPGSFNERTGLFTAANQGAGPIPLEHSAQGQVNNALEAAREADTRLRVMEKNAQDAIQNHDQQAMLSLLANHLGMTMGLQKGARMNQALIEEAEKSRPWLQGMQASFDKDGYLTGVKLSPQQVNQMMNLARERRTAQWQQAQDTGSNYGVHIAIPEFTHLGETSGHGETQPKGGAQRYQMNGREIVVQGGKWVYKDTGKAVE